mmetsp:Transcript_52361/g.109235  ORF Transcript_52361/g.109235 Transcript_52361/m.109235 type:complete len:514 (-) Transcript_52361:54-1595(-)
MPGLVGIIRSKTLPVLTPDVKNNPYAIAMKFPDESARLFDGELKLLLMDGAWHPRRLAYSNDVIAFALPGSLKIVDAIPLFELVEVVNMSDTDVVHTSPSIDEEESDSKSVKVNRTQKKSGDSNKVKFRHAVQLCTKTEGDGYNSGRQYIIQARNEQEHKKIIKDLTRLSKLATDKFLAKSQFEKAQEITRHYYKSTSFQIFVAVLIVANFAATATDAQLGPAGLDNSDGSKNGVGLFLQDLDSAFTAIFTVELLINMFAHWFMPFFSDMWCMFDLFIVSMSLISLGPVDLPASILRCLRAFRVLRLFARIKAVRQIISALSQSIVPVMNSFLIMGICTCIYSIMGVSFFRETAPDDFATFDRSFYAMFRVIAGETWVDSLRKTTEDGGLSMPDVCFVFSFIVIINWILLQVSVAVLLDKFITATADMEAEERGKEVDELKRKEPSNTLDPLLQALTRDYIDEDDLSNRLKTLFRVCTCRNVSHLCNIVHAERCLVLIVLSLVVSAEVVIVLN